MRAFFLLHDLNMESPCYLCPLLENNQISSFLPCPCPSMETAFPQNFLSKFQLIWNICKVVTIKLGGRSKNKYNGEQRKHKGLFGCCFQEPFSFLENKKHWKRVWERGWFLFLVFSVFLRGLFSKNKKKLFRLFSSLFKEELFSMFSSPVFCVSVHVVSPLAARNEGHGGWRWQPCWLTMVFVAWVNGCGCERCRWPCGALKGKATGGDVVSDSAWKQGGKQWW